MEMTDSPYSLNEFGTSDIIIAPFIERAHATLLYYKDFDLRKEFPAIGKWLDAMEKRPAYRGT